MQSTIVQTNQPPLPNLTNTAVAPPLPIENKPPLPPEEPPSTQTTSMSLFKPPGYNIATNQPPPNQMWQQKRPYGQGADNANAVKKPLLDYQWKTPTVVQTNYNQPPPQVPPKVNNVDELSEAEKKFDKEFAAWEAQFQKWKEQNANHPDKSQYREYEKKWESWRNSLLERREQMRKKRVALTSGTSSGTQQKIPNFSQPPPNMASKTNVPTTTRTGSVGQYPPPNQNNEPLSFKNLGSNENTGVGFLGSASPVAGGIPGLDLVKDDKDVDNDENDAKTHVPDLEAISKGINSILGDQKLLTMLSMVTKHPPPAPGQQKIDLSTQFNQQENQFVNTSLPPPTLPYRDNYNDQSNQSFEDRSNQGECHQREVVNNFDDQTRSSFTMGLNELDQGLRHRGMARFSDERFHNFNLQKNTGNDNVGPKSLMSLSFPPGGPKPSSNAPNFEPPGNDFGNYAVNRSNRNDDDDDYGNYGSENFNDNYNQDEDYDNYNDEEDYDKYHDMFNEDEQEYQENKYQRSQKSFQDERYTRPSYEGYQRNDSLPEDSPAPCPPNVMESIPEEPIFEPAKVIDYEHKSMRQCKYFSIVHSLSYTILNQCFYLNLKFW